MPTKQPGKNRLNWLYVRRGTQIAFFLLFLMLFLKAEYVDQNYKNFTEYGGTFDRFVRQAVEFPE